MEWGDVVLGSETRRVSLENVDASISVALRRLDKAHKGLKEGLTEVKRVNVDMVG